MCYVNRVCEITTKFVVAALAVNVFQMIIHQTMLQSIHGRLPTKPYVIVTGQIPPGTLGDNAATTLTHV